jgi:hypothetical protein
MARLYCKRKLQATLREMIGPQFAYSSLGSPRILKCLWRYGIMEYSRISQFKQKDVGFSELSSYGVGSFILTMTQSFVQFLEIPFSNSC